jgi:hypothetical protein
MSILCLYYKPKDIYLAVLVLDELQNNTWNSQINKICSDYGSILDFYTV